VQANAKLLGQGVVHRSQVRSPRPWRPAAITPARTRHEPVPVVLDLIGPLRTGRHASAEGRQAGRHKAGRPARGATQNRFGLLICLQSTATHSISPTRGASIPQCQHKHQRKVLAPQQGRNRPCQHGARDLRAERLIISPTRRRTESSSKRASAWRSRRISSLN
jgi:hypothetical protein